jgi:hypothetical protein
MPLESEAARRARFSAETALAQAAALTAEEAARRGRLSAETARWCHAQCDRIVFAIEDADRLALCNLDRNARLRAFYTMQ